MKIILQQYAGVVLTVLVAAMLFLLLATLPEKSLNDIPMFQTKERIGADEKAMRAYAARKKPVISYAGGSGKTIKHIRAGIQTNLYDFFRATDADDQRADLKILRIEKENGTVLFEKNAVKEGKILFGTPGKYYVVLKATDAQKVTRIQRLAIPVDSEE